jgi:hypothetical protein
LRRLFAYAQQPITFKHSGIVGTWHKVSTKHLQAYLDEMGFRFERRNRSDLFIDTLRHMATADPMTFDELTAPKQSQGHLGHLVL